MKQKLTLLLLFWIGYIGQAQTKLVTDTIVDMGIYKSYFNYSLKEPLYVTYHLSKGGGDCDRDAKGFSFKKCGIPTATDKDYEGSLYDRGHLANAEDFASDCDKLEKTFCYFNCVPQTVKLNRGIWKTWEKKTRDLSQTKLLFVIAGNIYGDKKLGLNQIGIPDYCYKIVLDAKTKKVLYCLIFPNNDSKSYTTTTLAALKKRLGYDLIP
jgi:DNA/RNA endonuclease G (NUC1)